MKSVVKVSVAMALAASVVSAQLDRFPDCAYECVTQLNAIVGCTYDTSFAGCFCRSDVFDALAPCVFRACELAGNPALNDAINDAAEGLCLGGGVTVTVSVAPAPTQEPPRELANFPGCARDCVSQLNAIAGCRETDFRCFCGSNAFLRGFNPCISLLCEPSDYDATSEAAEDLCADNGVTVTVTATFTPPPRPTNAPSSSSPAETTEPAETTGAEETEDPSETEGPAPTTVETVTVPSGATTTAPPTRNGTASGSGSTPTTTNAGARHTAFAGVLGVALAVGAALL